MIGDRGGVTVEDVARRYPCDDIVEQPVLQVWRGVTVQAPPEDVWPWISQVRLAPYSYDWIDNLGRRSPQKLRAVSEPAPGQRFTTACGRPLGRILTVEQGTHITGRIMGAVMSYVLRPEADATRLLLKIVIRRGRLCAPLLSIGDLIMARRQLLNLKRHAEQSVNQASC